MAQHFYVVAEGSGGERGCNRQPVECRGECRPFEGNRASAGDHFKWVLQGLQRLVGAIPGSSADRPSVSVRESRSPRGDEVIGAALLLAEKRSDAAHDLADRVGEILRLLSNTGWKVRRRARRVVGIEEQLSGRQRLDLDIEKEVSGSAQTIGLLLGHPRHLAAVGRAPSKARSAPPRRRRAEAGDGSRGDMS